MNRFEFSVARTVFHPNGVPGQTAVSQYGFYCPLILSEGEPSGKRTVIRLTARNFYRLYINGEIVMHGPARTAHGYCRVDELDITDRLVCGVNHLAVEVVAYGRDWAGYRHYSNDCTLEDGLFIAEIDRGGEIFAATGRDDWQVCRLDARRPIAERISHSRECIEIYDLNEDYYLWRLGGGETVSAVPIADEPCYLLREALKPTLDESFLCDLVDFGAVRIDQGKRVEPFFFEENNPLSKVLPERPTCDARRTVENPDGHLQVDYGDEGITLMPINTEDFAVTFDGGESRVGFVRIRVNCERAGVIDLVHSEMIDVDGSIPHYFNNVTRLHVSRGTTEFVTMEPILARYLRIYFRGVGAVTLDKLSMIDYSYPDEHKTSFLCSDDNVNRLYKAAKRTLLLNTLDIFMDCPDRERGGWLCDSLWTGRAASLMLSDDRVEREHIENFLLTPPESMGHAFFPEVYPALKEDYASFTGLTTWSFWLMCEVCEFIRRTGDIAFRDAHKPRIAAFVKGTRDFIGRTGLLENMPAIFVDWSLSNQSEYTQPISTAANALYAYMLTELGVTFGESEWVREGERVRELLRTAVLGGKDVSTLSKIPDSFTVSEDGRPCSREKFSEAALWTALWCGLFTPDEAPLLYRTVRDKTGPAPSFAKDPMVGSSQLFIGLCIRLDMLCRQGAFDKMYADLLAICEPQLREGPGTLWENQSIDTSSRCHGFTAHFGVHLVRDLLGLGFCLHGDDGEGEPTVLIAPHICGLRWARGTHETPEGVVSVDWRYDGESFALRVNLPKRYDCRVALPREVRMLDGDKVSVIVNKY